MEIHASSFCLRDVTEAKLAASGPLRKLETPTVCARRRYLSRPSRCASSTRERSRWVIASLALSPPGESSERPPSPGQVAYGMSQPGFGASFLPGAPGGFTIAKYATAGTDP
jgi:hypothetical protein